MLKWFSNRLLFFFLNLPIEHICSTEVVKKVFFFVIQALRLARLRDAFSRAGPYRWEKSSVGRMLVLALTGRRREPI